MFQLKSMCWRTWDRGRGRTMCGTLSRASALNILKLDSLQKLKPFVFWIIHHSACVQCLTVAKSRCVSVCPSRTLLHVHVCTRPPSGGYLTSRSSWLPTYSLTLSLRPPSQPPLTPLSPPSTLACWREPCNNPPCFHDNHLLLSSPHLSPPPSLSPLPLSLFPPLFLPLSCLPFLRTLLVFQGQRGSQADSEIETEIWVESGERGAITMGEKTDRGRLEDKKYPRHCYC